ncbi:hypothetical protein LZP69_08380 [Shewanella sp. AS1]|uniref:hypothetical protein n=1 Tax=Shewanella sp. AS1 TaxID=2907626 RepID=UPI001F351886|nr:hypothetical protein [Shewanella sp. AS1]MCE9679189.1 hypothetical protein [Shewanella sp. AS1]
MSTNRPIELPKIIKLFDFLDSETIESIKWITGYLDSKKYPQPPRTDIESIKYFLANHFLTTGVAYSDISIFAQKMGNAWRVRKHRQDKTVKTLSISLKKDVSDQLTQMCKGHKKTDIITLLITDSYEQFLAEKKAAKNRLPEEKRIKQQEKSEDWIEKEFMIPKAPQQPKAKIEQLNELKKGIANLYEIICFAHEQGKGVDDKVLLEATKLYYNAFNK